MSLCASSSWFFVVHSVGFGQYVTTVFALYLWSLLHMWPYHFVSDDLSFGTMLILRWDNSPVAPTYIYVPTEQSVWRRVVWSLCNQNACRIKYMPSLVVKSSIHWTTWATGESPSVTMHHCESSQVWQVGGCPPYYFFVLHLFLVVCDLIIGNCLSLN